MGKYITVQGDMWDSVALKVYNDEKLMHKLVEANPKYNRVVVFPANCELEIPEIINAKAPAFPSWRGNI